MKTKRSAASSRREKLIIRSEEDIRRYAKSADAKATAKRLKASGPDPTQADLKEIPALTREELASMYRVMKKPVTVRIDGDVLHWLKSKGGAYQKHLNATLRCAMLAEREGR